MGLSENKVPQNRMVYWLVVSTPLKNICQLGWFQTTNQFMIMLPSAEAIIEGIPNGHTYAVWLITIPLLDY